MYERCDDEIKIYSHLKDPILKSQTPYDEKICQQNSIDYVVDAEQQYYDVLQSDGTINRNDISNQTTMSSDDTNSNENLSLESKIFLISDLNRSGTLPTTTPNELSNGKQKNVQIINKSDTVHIDMQVQGMEHKNNNNGVPINTISVEQQFEDRNKFEKLNLKSIYSSDKVMALKMDFKDFRYMDYEDGEIFEIIGRYRYLNKDQFKIDGHLLPTTYCDYQFLPHSINFINQQHNDKDNLWRNFYSPRYPAKYPGHVKCTYKFIGRPTNLVEIIFEEIYLQNFNESCIHQRDKITIYNGKQPEKSFIIDVLCNELVKSQNVHKKTLRRIKSSGPYMLIEFDVYDSKRNSYGFKGRYRFIETNGLK